MDKTKIITSVMNSIPKRIKYASEWVKNEIDNLTKGEIVLTEYFINDCLNGFIQDHAIKLHDGCLEYKAENIPVIGKIEAKLAYDSCKFGREAKVITIKILDLKPFYIKPFLKTLPLKFPFVALGKDAERTQLITCHLNKIPALNDNKILNSPWLQYLAIKDLKCEEGKVAVKLGLTVELDEVVKKAKSIFQEKPGNHHECRATGSGLSL